MSDEKARRISALLEAGIPLGNDRSSTAASNPFIQPIDNEDLPETLEPMSSLKTEWMHRRLEECEAEFVETEGLTVIVGTWNVDGIGQPGALSEWLRARSPLRPDAVFVGLQEVDQSTQAYIYDGSVKEQFWNDALLSGINEAYPGAKFCLLASRLFVGIYGGLFVRREVLPFICHVSTSVAACGLMGIVGNKGGVGIRFRFHNDYICFISSHLAAHVPALQRRNQDAAEIARRTLFNAQPDVASPEASVIEVLIREYKSNPGPASIWDASLLIWAGDLNYRVPLDADMVRVLVSEGLYRDLLAHDQLLTERSKGGVVWSSFEEHPIAFAPTYKYDPGSSRFDTSEKRRAPAWCDRVLFRGAQLKCVEYDSAPSLMASDHKPVRAVFRATVNRIVRSRFEPVYERLLKQLDQLENQLIPATQLSCHQIDLGQLVFRRMVKRSVEIENVGQVACQFRLVPSQPDGRSICKPWLRIRPTHAILMPSERIELSLFSLVDAATCKTLNEGEPVDDILVIHVDGGRDHFVHISGTFRQTPFCRPLAELAPESFHMDPRSGREMLVRKVPAPVWLLVDFIIKHGITTEGLFLVSGRQEELDAIQDTLDDGKEIPPTLATEIGFLSAAETLIRFLDCLPSSLIPPSFYSSIMDTSTEDFETASSSIITRLPDANKVLFDYLTKFLGKHLLPRNYTVGRMDLAYVFAPVLLKPYDGHAASIAVPSTELRRAALFIAHVLK